VARCLRNANVYVANGRVVKFLRTNKYLEGTILHLYDTLFGRTLT
jgi:hypothetical protein